MNTRQDPYGNTLRGFYATFGVPNEGPPPEVNVSATFPNADGHADFELLDRMVQDHKLYGQFTKCRKLLDDVATTLSSGTLLLQELEIVAESMEFDIEHLTNGIFWFTLAKQMDPRESHSAYPGAVLPGELPRDQKLLLQVQGSLIFRLYIALVFMREGAAQRVLEAGSRAGLPAISKCRKLLECDYVRHLRNALSHGSIHSTIAGLRFRDTAGFDAVATPGFLTFLSTWVFLIQHCCVTVYGKRCA